MQKNYLKAHFGCGNRKSGNLKNCLTVSLKVKVSFYICINKK